MNENSNKKLTSVEAKQFSDVIEKTLLEISILDSLCGSSSIKDYVRNVFQASIEDIQDSRTLKTLTAIIAGDNEQKKENDEQELRRRCSNDEQYIMQEYVSLEKKLQILKRKEEEIDSEIDKCTEDGERVAIRRETEKNYVDKWEKTRVEHFKLKFKTEELKLQKKITELKAKLETEKLVDAENKQFLDYSINKLEKQIKYWECKCKTDTTKIDEELENRMITLKEKTKQAQSLKKTYIEKQNIIEEHTKNKQKLEEEKKLNDCKEKMATKIQAWWRGTMVRRHFGPYKHLLGSRKKSIKKQQVNKGKKTITK